MNKRGERIFFLFILLVVEIVSVSAIPQTFNVHGRLTNASSGSPLEGVYSVNFSLFNVYSSGGSLWTDVYSVDTDGNGVYNVILRDIDLPFSEQYYLEIKVEGETLAPRMNLTASPYSFMARNVSSSGISYDSNFNLGVYNISASYLFGNYAELDPKWSANFTNYNSSWSLTYNATYNAYNSTGLIKNWMADVSALNYWNSTFAVFNKTYADTLYLGKTGDNGTGEYNFNDGWQSGGLTISSGNLYAQTIYVYNITALEVNNLRVNGSIIPPVGFDNTFDIGSVSLRWRDLYLGRHLNVIGNVSAGGGTLFVDGSGGNVGIGTSAPAQKFDVNGSVNISMTSSNPYLYFGKGGYIYDNGAATIIGHN